VAKILWWRVGLGVLVVWLGLVVFGRLADRFILWPSHEPIAAGAAQRHAIAMPDGSEVEAWVMHARSAAPKRYLIRFYGNADRAENWADSESRDWPDDVESWAVNYPGYGSSTGTASLAGVARSALAAYDEIAKRSPGAAIYVVGTSLGTTAALHIAAERKVAGLVLFNPPPLRELVLGRFGWWNLWLLAYPVALTIPHELDSLGNAKRATAPALFVLSEDDEVVPHPYHLRISDAYAGPKETISRPGAGHNDPLEPPALASYHAALSRLFAR
jgi:fermentation-respiration switch protein FrsA (DUF1100 family)